MKGSRVIDLRTTVSERTMHWHAEALRQRSEILRELAESIVEELRTVREETEVPGAD